MVLRLATLVVLVPMGLVGCSGADGEKTDDTGPIAVDDTGGGGSGTTWRASGEGTAYFLDGTVDNSLFHLELTRCTEPAEGEAYYGWVSKGGEEAISVGEITVTSEEVYFEYDIGVNAIIGGYDTFEAWATDNGGTAREGTQLWAGQVDPVIYDTIQGLLISSDATPDGQGSLRSMESALENIRVTAQELEDSSFELTSFRDGAESIANALDGTEDDHNDDGTISTIDGQLGILGDAGYIQLITDDFTVATQEVDPGNPIKDYINYALDCTQAIEAHADEASGDADVASVCLEETTCGTRMDDVIVELDYALNGEDINEDGVIDDLSNPTEGTLDCAISYVSQMAQMTVEVP